jgi:hypothetical protein
MEHESVRYSAVLWAEERVAQSEQWLVALSAYSLECEWVELSAQRLADSLVREWVRELVVWWGE